MRLIILSIFLLLSGCLDRSKVLPENCFEDKATREITCYYGRRA